jgi:hypothetical protein
MNEEVFKKLMIYIGYPALRHPRVTSKKNVNVSMKKKKKKKYHHACDHASLLSFRVEFIFMEMEREERIVSHAQLIFLFFSSLFEGQL